MFTSMLFMLPFIAFLQCLAQQSPRQARVLVYSATRRFRHDSIPDAIAALKAHGPTANILFDDTEEQSRFTDSALSTYDAILFLDNTGEVLDDSGIGAFQRYLNAGGNFIGIHSASDCLVNTTFYGREVGAYFDNHPPIQTAIVNVIGPAHPSTSMLPRRWQVLDEMYDFKSDPRAVGAVVILSVDESSYTDTGPRMYDQGVPHPTAWYQERGAGAANRSVAGRSFYTSLGHLSETWQDEMFMAHVMGGISWVLESNSTRVLDPSASASTSRGLVSQTGSPPMATSQASGSPNSVNLLMPSIFLVVAAVRFLFTAMISLGQSML